MNYKFERDNHVHLLEGFYDLITHDNYNITNIELTLNSSPTIITQIPISNERLRLVLKNYIERDFGLGKYDNRIKYPVNFKLEDFDNCLISIEHIVTNEHKQLYKLKQFYYESIEDLHKVNKYQHKLETPNYVNNKIQVFAGGAQIPLVKDIPENICDGLPDQKPKGIIEVFSEPLTRSLFSILRQVCITELTLYINPNEFVYIKNETSARMYHMQCNGSISFSDFESKYNNLFDTIDQAAKLDGLDSLFDEEYVKHFRKETFENNTWKSRIMAHHIMEHKYAHNGIGSNEFADVIKIIFMLDLDSDAHMWSGLQFVHSIAHLYDDIYMRPSSSNKLISQLQILDEIKRDMFEPDVQRFDCLRKIINKYRSDFLVKTGDNFDQPYHIKPEALDDKKRQYSGGWFSSAVMVDFENQIRGYSYARSGETNKMILEDYV